VGHSRQQQESKFKNNTSNHGNQSTLEEAYEKANRNRKEPEATHQTHLAQFLPGNLQIQAPTITGSQLVSGGHPP